MPRDDELGELMRRVHDELGYDAYESAARKAGAMAKASTPRTVLSGEKSAVRLVNVSLHEEYLIPEDVYLDALRRELRRLVQPH
jgi:hypothetical protein